MIACLFSGQGSQTPEMGQDLVQKYSSANSLYTRASAYLGENLLSLTEEELHSTRIAQLAIVTMSLAAWQVYKDTSTSQTSHMFAGFSLGEYSALAAAEVLEFEDLLDLVNERSLLMQSASDKNPGSMHAIIGMKESEIQAVLSRKEWHSGVYAANYNAPGQIVISGQADLTDRCAAYLLGNGARRAVKLNVSGAFHTPLMQEAAIALAAYARKFSFKKPVAPLYSNTLGQIVPSDVNWPDLLARHMISPVMWIDEIKAMDKENPSCWLEFGPGAVLTGMIRKIAARTLTYPIRNSQDLEQLAEYLASIS